MEVASLLVGCRPLLGLPLVVGIERPRLRSFSQVCVGFRSRILVGRRATLLFFG
jgi:hypothetical protein